VNSIRPWNIIDLTLPINPVWWGSMPAILSYHGNRPPPTHTHPRTHRQDRLQYTVAQLVCSVIKVTVNYCFRTSACVCVYVCVCRRDYWHYWQQQQRWQWQPRCFYWLWCWWRWWHLHVVYSSVTSFMIVRSHHVCQWLHW